MTKTLFLDINVQNGTTGVLVGLVYSSTDAHPIRVNASTIAIGPISSYLKMPMSGQRYLCSQLPLMSGKGFSEHKSQSMTIAGGVVLDMNCRHFAANGTYVAITSKS